MGELTEQLLSHSNTTRAYLTNVSTWKKWNSGLSIDQTLRFYHRKLITVSFALMLIGFISNGLVCMVVIRGRRTHRRTLSNAFILNLSIADIIFRIVYIITRVVIPTLHTNISIVECKIMIYSHYACAAVTFALLAGIAIDRHQHIMHPLKYFSLTLQRKILIILSFWIYAGIVSTGFLVVGEDRPYTFTLKVPSELRQKNQSLPHTIAFRSRQKRCTLAKGAFSSQLAFTPYFLLAFLVPLLVITITYTSVFYHLKKRSKNRISKMTAKSKTKALKMLLQVVVSFILSWAPIMVLDLLRAYGMSFRVVFPVRAIGEALSHSSSIINPVIYAFGNANFRKEMGAIFRTTAIVKCSTCKRNNHINDRVQLQ